MTEQAAFSARATFRSGATVGSYLLKQPIEESVETGPAFLARHVQSGTLYRLRILIPPAGITPEDRLIALGQFQKVASQLAVLQHPLLLPLTDYGSAQGVPYLVSPMFSAQPLQTLIARGPMNPLLVGRYLDGIAAALEHAHQQGILHLNLNPRCIFVRKAGNLFVADFALPRFFAYKRPLATPPQQDESQQSASLLFDSKGKLLYSFDLTSAPAPELLRGEAIDARADVYALGAVLYQMLTGHRAFHGATLRELAQQHLQTPVQPPSVWRRELPRALDELFMQTLAKDPARRFRSPGALADAYHQIVAPTHTSRQPFSLSKKQTPLRPLAVGQEETSRTRPAAPGTPQKAPDALSRRRVITLAVAGGAVVVVGAVVVLVVPSLRGKGSASATVPPHAPTSSGNSSPVSTASSAPPFLARTSDLPLNSAKPFPIAQSNNPGLLIHLPDNRFVAFNSTCTHAGCAVDYSTQDHLLVCPCHGAIFDPSTNGAVVQGPAPLPLAPIAITVNADQSITLDQ